MIYDKDRNENNSAHRWMNSFKRKTFKIKRILPSWYIRAFMFLIYRYFWFLNKKYFPLSWKNNVITWNERKKKRMNTGVFYFFCPDMEVCVSCNQHDSWWKRRHISISFGHTGLLKYEEGICYWRVFHLACHIIHNRVSLLNLVSLHTGESLCSFLNGCANMQVYVTENKVDCVFFIWYTVLYLYFKVETQTA